MLADAHVHLEEFTPEELEAAMKQARDKGVTTILAQGITTNTSAKAVEFASAYDIVWAGVGKHPFWPKAIDQETYDRLKALCKNKRVVCIGEVGLDRVRDVSTIPVQGQMFISQLLLANEVNLPMNIHCNQAHDELLRIFEHNTPPARGAMMHGYNGDWPTAQRYLDMGFYISIGRSALEPSRDFQEVVQKVPLERMVLETDCTGGSYREQGVGPAAVATVAEAVAKVRGLSPERLGNVTTQNLRKLMGFR